MLQKNENKIFSEIIQFLNKALIDLRLTDWQVLQLFQPEKLNTIKPTVYISFDPFKRIGWQSRYYPIIDNNLKIKEKFFVEILTTISAVKKRCPNDTKDTITSSDVLELLKAYLLNINNLTTLKQKGYSIFNPSIIQKQQFIDDSDNFEFLPSFRVSFLINQTLINAQTAIDDYTLRIERL